ncbi:hypothetical protein JOE31_001356 [Arthrobacter sp. PvP023]|uniref:Ig-like domain-containing protein n=1 Tax=Micrococcaceae TaxID=1268 RepID=UPI001AE95298|nr:hypothetical protein [Arthrobacter sp. PvP023]MBP1135124.1 hypothetical protein [Arthrobacter sp. PvP023]
MTPHLRRSVTLAAGLATVLFTGCAGAGPGSGPEPSASGQAAQSRDSLVLVGDLPSPVSAGEDFAPLSVELRDANGKEIAGVTVTFTVKSGDAAFPATLVTDVSDDLGVATAAGLKAGAATGTVEVAVAAAEKSTTIKLEVK